jgi:cell wall-associated NlpC family hydrolase
MLTTFYRSTHALNIYDSSQGDRLATQMAAGRHLLGPAAIPESTAAAVILAEDDYPGWVAPTDWHRLQPSDRPQPNPVPTLDTIARCIPEIVDYILHAMAQPHRYLWGGTLPPSYDCSGLIQAAFAAQGIWLPRDAYQQHAFVTPIPAADLGLGDLVFFRTAERITHVGLALNGSEYLHCSGQERGHNGIARGDRRGGTPIDDFYAHHYCAAGRVTAAYASRTLTPTGGNGKS